ncbi:hypothetical protein D3C81_1123310 [compost metagenome]
MFFRRRDIGLRRTQDRAAFDHLLPGFVEVGWQQVDKRRRSAQLIRHLANHAQVVGLGVCQVGLLGNQVVTGLGQTRFGLVEVSQTPHAAGSTQLDLVVDAFVTAQVVFSQAHHFATGEDVEVNLGDGQRGALGGTEQGVSARVNGGLLTPYFAGGGKTVKNHLPQTQAGFTTVEGFPTVARARTVGPFAPVTCQHIDLRQIAALGSTQLVVGRNTAVDPGLDFRMHLKGFLHGFRQALCLNETGSKGERKSSEQ